MIFGPRETKAPPQPAEPAYHEVWGGLESANRALWIALWVSSSAMLLSLVLLRVVLTRAPIVIAVTGSGEAAVLADAGRQPPVSPAEVKNFLTLFERFFTELNAYTYDSSLKQAFTMMSAGFQSKANDMLKRAGTIEGVKAAQAKTTLTLTEVKALRDTPQLIECSVKGYRQVASYKADEPQTEVVFEDDIILRKVPRSEEAPFGLLVEDYHESVFKR